jgi:hypothetical protein
MAAVLASKLTDDDALDLRRELSTTTLWLRWRRGWHGYEHQSAGTRPCYRVAYVDLRDHSSAV